MKTIYDKYAFRTERGGRNWGVIIPLLIVVCVIFGVLSVSMSGGGRMYMPGYLILAPILMIRKNKQQNVTFFVRYYCGDNFSYGYVDEKHQRYEYNMEEYTYWYNQGETHGNMASYELYMMFTTNGQPVIVREIKKLSAPPQGWTLGDRPKKGPGQFIAPGLQELAILLDAQSTDATNQP